MSKEKCKEIKLGFFGAGRSGAYIGAAKMIDNVKIAAVCDFNPNRLEGVKRICTEDTKYYSDFDTFLEEADMDAVVLCNFFDEHAPYAIRCMEKGLDVLSETQAINTMAEGVALCRTVEKTGRTYMLSENYPFMCANLELKRLYEEGTLGEVIYAEGEYVHPMNKRDMTGIAPGWYHWRNWIPSTYYNTHATAPLMHITGAMPKSVTGMSVFCPSLIEGTSKNNADIAGIMLVKMDNGAIFRVMGCGGFAGEGNWYRIAGSRGAAETVRGNMGDILLRYNHWDVPEGKEAYQQYTAQWAENGDLAAKAGHGGGDFWVVYEFVRCLREGIHPFFDAYRAAAVSAVGIQGWKSCLAGGEPFEIPDFANEEDRKRFENDTASAKPYEDGTTDFPVSTQPYAPTSEDYATAYRIWGQGDLPKELYNMPDSMKRRKNK